MEKRQQEGVKVNNLGIDLDEVERLNRMNRAIPTETVEYTGVGGELRYAHRKKYVYIPLEIIKRFNIPTESTEPVMED